MSKGFIKLSVLEVESEYYNERKVNISLIADDSTFTVCADKCPTKFNNVVTFFPLADHL